MPTALLKDCAYPGCTVLVDNGRCAEHARAREQWRGTAASRGYDSRWVAFKRWFINRLIALDLAPVCGARLPGAVETTDSQCKAAGVLTWRGLHLDHTPPLREDERQDWAIVCDAMRVQLLCAHCHSAKTRREQQGG